MIQSGNVLALADHTIFYKESPNVHVIIPYSDFKKLNNIVAIFFNEGLKRNQLCVYCSVDISGESANDLFSRITDYEKNVSDENLLVVDFRPFVPYLLRQDLKPLEELKKTILINLLKRKDKHVRLHGDLVSFLFENNHFDEALLLEEWWQNDSFEGTKICPYRNTSLEQSSVEKKEKIVNSHDKIVLC